MPLGHAAGFPAVDTAKSDVGLLKGGPARWSQTAVLCLGSPLLAYRYRPDRRSRHNGTRHCPWGNSYAEEASSPATRVGLNTCTRLDRHLSRRALARFRRPCEPALLEGARLSCNWGKRPQEGGRFSLVGWYGSGSSDRETPRFCLHPAGGKQSLAARTPNQRREDVVKTRGCAPSMGWCCTRTTSSPLRCKDPGAETDSHS